jgi:hypothetical protein
MYKKAQISQIKISFLQSSKIELVGVLVGAKFENTFSKFEGAFNSSKD